MLQITSKSPYMNISKIIVYIVPVLFLASCGTTEKSPQTASTTQVPYTQIVSSLKNEYQETPQFASCMSNYANLCATQAITAVANAKSDEQVCNDMSSDSAKDSCKTSVVTEKAKKTGDVGICEALQGGKQNCLIQVYTALAVKNKDKKMCDKIKTSGTDKNTPQATVNEAFYTICVSQVR